ncbi:hypothetical protein [Antarcticibacterium sp. 1MA-6-2]|uniref:hypothetical protein n=1 Tax=Antarcticibacterium sp. 1MA-6-2 TaxID=2908210 RepID=UPI002106B6AC|nr:hypothetical protein [Antarcticibacterium sp. 1MA-6-2]
MISVTEARRILSENLERAEKTLVALQNSRGRILAEDVYSPIDVPSFDNSAMDGYALIFDGKRNEWKLEGVIQAGDTSVKNISEGKAIRIFT